MPNFINHDGSLSDDGRKLADFLEVNVRRLEDMNVAELNQQPGIFKYAFSRMKTNDVTMAQLIQEQARTFAVNAWNLYEGIQAQEQQAEQVQENTEATNEVAAELEKFKEAMTKQLAALKGENTKLRNKIATLEAEEEKPADDDAATEEEEPEADTDEDEDDGEAE